MWFLIPTTLGLLAMAKNKEKSSFEDKMELEYRRIYFCHSFYYSKTYKVLVRKLKLSDDHKVWNYSIPHHKQRNVKDDEELRVVFKQQMRGCSHVFVYANINLPKKSYVKMELEVAQELGKTIFAIRPKGSYYTPPFIKQFSPEYIWNDIRTVQKTLRRLVQLRKSNNKKY